MAAHQTQTEQRHVHSDAMGCKDAFIGTELFLLFLFWVNKLLTAKSASECFLSYALLLDIYTGPVCVFRLKDQI